MRTSDVNLFNWDITIDSIEEGKTVLVLGADVYADMNEGTLHDQMRNFLLKEKVPIQKYYKQDGFFLFEQPHLRTFACHQIKEFYKTVLPNDTLQKIVHIPFHIILTITPDKLIHRAFSENHFKFQYGFYKKDTDPQNIQPPERDFPLVYNAFGSLDNEESIILTHDDLYHYFKSIFSRSSMPEQVKTALQEIKNIIFLGVSFDKWYMHLLLREFGVHNKKDILRFAANQSVSNKIRTFCFQQFKIEFIEHNVDDFIDELYVRFQQKGLLRQKVIETVGDKIEQMKQLVSIGNVEHAIEILREFAEGTDLADEAVGISSRYRRYKRKVTQNVLDESQKEIEINRITTNLLELINEAKDK